MKTKLSAAEARLAFSAKVRELQAKLALRQEKDKDAVTKQLPTFLKGASQGIDAWISMLDVMQLTARVMRTGVRSPENAVRFVHRLQNAGAVALDMALDAVNCFVDEMPEEDLGAILTYGQALTDQAKNLNKVGKEENAEEASEEDCSSSFAEEAVH